MPLREISVEDVYKRDPKLKKEDVNTLIVWMEKQPHLPKATELQVIFFLQSCYYSNEAAKNTIDTYFTVKTICPDMFGSRTFQNELLKEAADIAMIAVLPKPVPSGDSILIAKLMDGNASLYNPSEQSKLFDIVTLLHMHENGPMDGLQIIVDMNLSTFGHLLKLSPVVIKKFLYYLQEGMPIRLKRIHFINIVSFMDKLLALIKPFMKKELFESLVMHSDIKTLFKYVPQELLPAEYGGSWESSAVLQEKLKNSIRDNENLLKFQESQLVDESKRQGPTRNAENLFGVEGSFKKLDVD